MIVKYIIGIAVGWIVSPIIIMELTVLRFGIPLCNKLLKNKEDNEKALKGLKKKYCLSLIIWIPIITLISLLCYNFLDKGFYGYIITIIFMTIIGFNSTGNNENNISDFYNSLQSLNIMLHDENKLKE